MTTTDLARLDPDEPVPFTLTPKADAFLDCVALAARYAETTVVDGALYLRPALVESIIDGAAAWACSQCGAAWFGPLPADGLCPDCETRFSTTAGPRPCPACSSDFL